MSAAAPCHGTDKALAFAFTLPTSWACSRLRGASDAQGVDLDEAGIAREAARLRKAFARLKEELRSLATREGLLGGD